MNSIMDILYIPFGYIMKFCCLIAGNNYVIALFFFALLLQVVLFPLGIKQQKSQITMAKLRPKEMAIRKKYAGRTDKPTQQKMNMEIQQLYADNGYNPLSGCLPLLIQLPIIIALFTVVRNPITYTVNLGGNELDTHNLYVDAVTMIEEARTRIPADTDDADLKALSENLIAIFLHNDPLVIEYGSMALRLQCITFPLVGWITISNMMLQTIGRTVKASLLAMSRQFLFFVPAVLLLPNFLGMLGVQLSQPIADVFSFLLAVPLALSELRDMNRLEEQLRIAPQADEM